MVLEMRGENGKREDIIGIHRCVELISALLFMVEAVIGAIVWMRPPVLVNAKYHHIYTNQNYEGTEIQIRNHSDHSGV